MFAQTSVSNGYWAPELGGLETDSGQEYVYVGKL